MATMAVYIGKTLNDFSAEIVKPVGLKLHMEIP